MRGPAPLVLTHLRAHHLISPMPPVRPVEIPNLMLRRISEPRPPASGPDDFDVINRDGIAIGRVLRARITPADLPWMWSLVDGEETLATGFAASREAAMRDLANARIMTDCLPTLMLKRTDRRDEECYAVMNDSQVVGHIRLSDVTPAAAPWVWTIASGHPGDYERTHGYAATRDAAMQAFGRNWRRED
jgi:hypothetical protein